MLYTGADGKQLWTRVLSVPFRDQTNELSGVIVVVQPFTEWVIHVYVLHWRPREIAGKKRDLYLAYKHRLHHQDPNVAQSAIEAVGQLRTREAVPALLKLVHGELWLQLAAINALGAIGAAEAVQPLMALVPDSVLAEPAVQALRSIAAPESLELMLTLLPGVHERALLDPLLLAIAVVIDLHPDPAPLLARAPPGSGWTTSTRGCAARRTSCAGASCSRPPTSRARRPDPGPALTRT